MMKYISLIRFGGLVVIIGGMGEDRWRKWGSRLESIGWSKEEMVRRKKGGSRSWYEARG
jgi:hypothetical protein